MWWDPDTIERTVTRQFVCSHLIPQEIQRLDTPLGFGDGLTDGTYWEWIDQRAKRIFLILVDLGVPDQIFGLIDDSWEDNDLPIALDQVERLALTPSRDERSERRFYYRQFHYLLRPLCQGDHFIFQENEVVPLEAVEKRQTLGSVQSHYEDKVALPNHPGMVFCRRRTPLGPGYGPSCLSHEDFLYEINSIKNLQNQHLVSYFASYVHQGQGYILFTPAADFSLRSLLTTTPSSVKSLDKQVRRRLVMNWILCLVDTLSYIHNRALSHGNIKPSTILFSNENHVFYADFTRFNPQVLASMTDKASFDKESYDYAAPEQWFRPSSSPATSSHRRMTLSSIASPESYSFSISRGQSDHSSSPAALMQAPTPHLNPQAADVFSLACVILELVSFLLKKHGRAFATHRAAKHKSPGRGGAVLDSSFHRNLGQVESWMTQLAKEAAKKDDVVCSKGIAPMLHVVERMLALHPSERPAIHDVQTRMYQILRDACGILEPHCVHQYGGWDFGIGSLKLNSSALDELSIGNSSNEIMSIPTRRSSGSRSFEKTRMGSSSGSSTTTRRAGGLMYREALDRSRVNSEAAMPSVGDKDKARLWQTPVYNTGE